MASNSRSRRTQKGDDGSDPKDNKTISQPSVNGPILMIHSNRGWFQIHWRLFFWVDLGPWIICALVKALGYGSTKNNFFEGDGHPPIGMRIPICFSHEAHRCLTRRQQLNSAAWQIKVKSMEAELKHTKHRNLTWHGTNVTSKVHTTRWAMEELCIDSELWWDYPPVN